MTQNDHAEAGWTGRDLLDANGDTIGTVEEVRHGDPAGKLTWLVVDPGVSDSNKLFIPANDVRSSGEALSVPYAKARVKGAPAVEGEAALTDTDQVSLCRYYGLVHPGLVGEAAEGCEDMPDVRPAG